MTGRATQRKTGVSSTGEITRRTVLRGAALGMAALAAGVDPLSAEPESKPPNMVFIMADDLGYADVACYGRPDLHTPSIDALAARGVRFLQAYANSAVCSATRTALITGRYQDRLSVGLDEPLAGRDIGLPPERAYVAIAVEKGGLRHHAGRQVASRPVAEIRPAAERIRPLLRLSRRRFRLLHPPGPLRRRCGRTTRRATSPTCSATTR